MIAIGPAGMLLKVVRVTGVSWDRRRVTKETSIVVTAEMTNKVNGDPETLYTEFQPDFEYEIWKPNGELSKGTQYED